MVKVWARGPCSESLRMSALALCLIIIGRRRDDVGLFTVAWEKTCPGCC